MSNDFNSNPQSAAIKDEIESLNLNVLLLAQAQLKMNRVEAMLTFGMDDKTASILESMPIRQLQKVAKIPYFLFSVRFDKALVWEIITQGQADARSLAHAMIIGAAGEGEAV